MDFELFRGLCLHSTVRILIDNTVVRTEDIQHVAIYHVCCLKSTL